jgi:hypothetical protein
VAVGPAGGLTVPLGGNIVHYQPSWVTGFDIRVTGFQPVIGLGLSAGYTRFRGPHNDSITNDSSKFSYRYVPATVYLLTDLSRIFTRPPFFPYLRIGVGPCYWDVRYDTMFFTTLDSTKSRQWDYAFSATLGAEKRLGRLPLSVFLDLTANYVTSSHFEKYSPLDKDESYAAVSLGFRYHLR